MMTPTIVLSAVTANGIGSPVLVKDAKHIGVTIAGSGLSSGETFTVKFAGSNEETYPDFASAKSSTNLWDYVQAIKLSDGSVVDGATGDLFSASNDVRLYEVNTNGLVWFNIIVSDVSGSIVADAKVQLFR